MSHPPRNTYTLSPTLEVTAQEEPTRLIGDRYRLRKQIGAGGTSRVYEAEHQLTKELVALKLIPLRRVGDTKTVARFLREAKLTQGLNHPGFVQIYDAWIDADEQCCLVMERLYGESLRELSSRGQITRRGALEAIAALLEPLSLAHERGVVHRDLKPDNIFLHTPPQSDTQVVKLLDFGLSRSALEPTVTHTGQFVGTPWYISPEQAFSPKEVTASSDVWSIGVILYELMTDQVPFQGESLPVICMSIKQDTPRPPHELNPALSLPLSALISQCLSKDPQDRPQDARALQRALSAVLTGALQEEEEERTLVSGVVKKTAVTLEEEEEEEEKEDPKTLPMDAEEVHRHLAFATADTGPTAVDAGPTAVGTLFAIEWGEGELEGELEGDTESLTALDEVDEVSEVSEVSEAPDTLITPPRGLSSHHTPSLKLSTHNVQALSRLSLSDVDPKPEPSASPEAQALAAAVTQRKGISPFAGRELSFEALEESAELIDFAGEPSELASLPTAPELVASREPLPLEPTPRGGRGLFLMSLLLFLSAVLFALWRLGVLAQL